MSRVQTLGIAVLTMGLCGCLAERVDNTVRLEGRPLMALMRQIGGPFEEITPPAEGEGRVINETQKLWHYLSVSSNTSLVLLRSRYSSLFTVQETAIARFENPAFGTFIVNAVDEDVDDANEVHTGHIKFTAQVEAPSPGMAKGEIYPFPRTSGSETIPPSLQMILPPGFVVPSNSHIDYRKRFMQDTDSIRILQQLIRAIYAVTAREVTLPGRK